MKNNFTPPPPPKPLIIAVVGIIFSVSSMFPQSQNWWRTNGNTPQSTDFLGTSNASPLIIKTNNTERIRIAPNGFIGIGNSNPQYVLDVNGRTKLRYNVYCDSLLECSYLKVQSLLGNGNALLSTDSQGNISRFNWSGNNNDVLTGNGNWVSIYNLISVPSPLWQSSGQNIFYNNGYVGIGTNQPLFSLDVVGDIRVSNNVYVGGGIVISDKVNAFTEVTAPKVKAAEATSVKLITDSIMMDSTKAIYGNTIIKGDVKMITDADILGDLRVNNKLTIQGNARFNGLLTATQGLMFNDSVGLKVVNGSGNNASGTILYFGKGAPPPPPVNPCTNPPLMPQINIGGAAQLIWNNTSLTLWADGANSIIDHQGNGSLLINWHCGKDVIIGSLNSGDLHAHNKIIGEKDVYLATTSGNVGIGTSAPTSRLDVIGEGKFRQSGGYVSVGFNSAHAYLTGSDSTAGDGKAFLINYYDPNTDVIISSHYAYVTGRLGIGTNNYWCQDTSVRLAVNGHIKAKELVIELNGWCDKRLYKDFKRMSLEEKEAFIFQHHHLPEMKSEKELKEKGIHTNEVLKGMLSNIEDNTMEIIELYRMIKELKQENEELKKEIEKLKKH